MIGTTAILSLNLNTFIRYYSLDPSKRMAEVSRRMQSRSGYDYYHILAKAVEARASGATADEIEYILNNTSNPSEASHNRAAYEKFDKKFGRKRGLALFERKSRVSLCGGQLIIYVNPLFSVESASGFDVYNIWASQSLNLDRARAGVGVHLMNVAFSKTAPKYNYKMFDAFEGKVYSTVNNTIPKAIDEIALSIVSTAKEA
ncbi:hypothetical protein GH722_04020 [Alphaproteobacteria bacterium HT1-32]|nr:hypothetical protein [Alphaproteobacteria bacterium HT1-32]